MVDFSNPKLRLHAAAFQHLESALDQRHGLRQIERRGALAAPLPRSLLWLDGRRCCRALAGRYARRCSRRDRRAALRPNMSESSDS